MTSRVTPSYNEPPFSFPLTEEIRGGVQVDFTLNPAQEAFREEVRNWLKTNIPHDWEARAMGSADIPRTGSTLSVVAIAWNA